MNWLAEHQRRDHIWFQRGGVIFEVVAAGLIEAPTADAGCGSAFVGLRNGVVLAQADDKWSVMASLVRVHHQSEQRSASPIATWVTTD